MDPESVCLTCHTDSFCVFLSRIWSYLKAAFHFSTWGKSFTNAARMQAPCRSSPSPPCWNVSFHSCTITNGFKVWYFHSFSLSLRTTAAFIYLFQSSRPLMVGSWVSQWNVMKGCRNPEQWAAVVSLNVCRCWSPCCVGAADGGGGGEEHGAAEPLPPGWALQLSSLMKCFPCFVLQSETRKLCGCIRELWRSLTCVLQ